MSTANTTSNVTADGAKHQATRDIFPFIMDEMSKEQYTVPEDFVVRTLDEAFEGTDDSVRSSFIHDLHSYVESLDGSDKFADPFVQHLAGMVAESTMWSHKLSVLKANLSSAKISTRSLRDIPKEDPSSISNEFSTNHPKNDAAKGLNETSSNIPTASCDASKATSEYPSDTPEVSQYNIPSSSRPGPKRY